MKVIIIIISLTLLLQINTLSGSEAASKCYCDVNQNFCDFDCCCDRDCSTTISQECYNRKSLSYCPEPTFFSRIKSSYANSQGCFYYNSTNKIIEEVSPGVRQILTIINQQYRISRQNKNSVSAPKAVGYKQGDIIKLNTNQNFFMVDSAGDCLADGVAGTFPLKFRFGVSTNLYCKCSNNSCGNSQIYSSFSGKSIEQFKDDSNKKITLPTISQNSNNVKLIFVVGAYGTQRSKYIERVTMQQEVVSGSNDKRLSIIFVQSSQIKQKQTNPSFFPQIPKDMFYPIFFIS